MPTHRPATYPSEKPSPATVASVEVDPLDPTTSDSVDASGGGYAGATGGSAFAHLTEDEATGSLLTDWGFMASFTGDFADSFCYLDPSGQITSHVVDGDSVAFRIAQVGDAANRLESNGDGSLHWGDGSAAPDTSLERYAQGYLGLGDDDAAFVVGGRTAFDDGSSKYLQLQPNRLDFWAESGYADNPDADAILRSTSYDLGSWFFLRRSGKIEWGDGTAAADVGLRRTGAGALGVSGALATEGAGSADAETLSVYDSGTPENWAVVALRSQGHIVFSDGDNTPDARIERSGVKTLNLTNDTNDLILKVNGVTVTVP